MPYSMYWKCLYWTSLRVGRKNDVNYHLFIKYIVEGNFSLRRKKRSRKHERSVVVPRAHKRFQDKKLCFFKPLYRLQVPDAWKLPSRWTAPFWSLLFWPHIWRLLTFSRFWTLSVKAVFLSVTLAFRALTMTFNSSSTEIKYTCLIF